MRTLARLAGALLCALSLQAAAAPFAVRLGLEKIVLDTPPGFTDTTDLASPRLQDLAATLTQDSNKILMFALSDTDVRRFTQGDPLDAKRYLIAVTPKALERVRVTPVELAPFIADALQNLGKLVETGDVIKYLEGQPVGKAVLFAELKRDPEAVSVLQGTRLPPLPPKILWEDPQAQYLFFTTTIFLVRGKVLRLDVFTTNAAELGWLKTTTQRWMDELLRLNPR